MPKRNLLPEMNRLQRRMDNLFGQFFIDPFSAEEMDFIPACDVEETNDEFLISFDLPGVKKEDVKIDVRENLISVSGERKEEVKGRQSRERYYGTFSRSFSLPSNINSEKAEARFENGVLQIALPKMPVPASKQIPIKGGKLIEGKAEKPAA